MTAIVRTPPPSARTASHSAVDDHSRPACSEILPDERQHSAIALQWRANAFSRTHGVTVERVLTDNASRYKSKQFLQSLTSAGISHKKIRPYRPQTNGRVERFNRTLADEWACQRPYTSDDERTAPLEDFLHTYNHHRRPCRRPVHQVGNDLDLMDHEPKPVEESSAAHCCRPSPKRSPPGGSR
ncbi:transposase family protein [Streptomyces sp. M54]|nr:transposase family protein [Streptomyces sp. M54]